MRNKFIETAVMVCLIILSIFLLNPFHFWMPDMMVILLLAVTLGLFGIFASFILREGMVDERDGLHRTLAGRNAFLAGAGVLTLAILVQGYNHEVDPWLVIALVTMILVKILTRSWSDRNL